MKTLTASILMIFLANMALATVQGSNAPVVHHRCAEGSSLLFTEGPGYLNGEEPSTCMQKVIDELRAEQSKKNDLSDRERVRDLMISILKAEDSAKSAQ